MQRRFPEWAVQLVSGLRNGKDWFVRELRNLPVLLRVGGWVVLQAVLFKVQPQLWRGLVRVVDLITGVAKLNVRTQLLLVVLLLLAAHVAFVAPKLKRMNDIVENMDSNTDATSEAVADGGSPANRKHEDELSPTGAGAICGVIAGGAMGILWGPPAIIGLAVLGAMVGDEWEQRILKA